MRKGMEFEHLIPEWKKLYNDGMSFTEIGKMYNCSKNTVGRTLGEHVTKRPKSVWNQYADKWADLYENEGYSKTDIARKYGTAIGVVTRVLKTKGIGVHTAEKKYAHLTNDFIHLYKSGMPLSAIAEKHGVSSQTVLNYLRDEGIEIRSTAESSRKYPIIEDYFDEIDTKEKAYFLGIAFATGTSLELYNAHCLNISIQESKLHVIKPLIEKLRGGKNYGGLLKGADNVYRIRLHSKKLFDRLMELGLKNRADTEFPDLSDDLIPAFILGYMEDRATYIKEKFDLMISGNKKFLEQLQKILKKVVKEEKIFLYEKESTYLAIYDNNELEKLHNWLTFNSGIFDYKDKVTRGK